MHRAQLIYLSCDSKRNRQQAATWPGRVASWAATAAAASHSERAGASEARSSSHSG